MQSPVSGLLLGQSQEVPSLVDNPRPRSTLASLPLQEVRREQSLAVAEALPTLRANDGSLPVRKQQVETEQRLSAGRELMFRPTPTPLVEPRRETKALSPETAKVASQADTGQSAS